MASRGYHLLMNGKECCGIGSRYIGGAVSTASPEKFMADQSHCKRCEGTKAGKRLLQLWRERIEKQQAD